MIDRSELTERIGNCMPVFFIRFILGFIYVKIKYLIEHKIILLLLNAKFDIIKIELNKWSVIKKEVHILGRKGADISKILEACFDTFCSNQTGISGHFLYFYQSHICSQPERLCSKPAECYRCQVIAFKIKSAVVFL